MRFKRYLDEGDLPEIKKIHPKEEDLLEWSLMMESSKAEKILKWLKKADKDDPDIDEDLADKFKIDEIKAGKIIAVFVKEKADKDIIKKINIIL